MRRRKFAGIQALRAIAALMVVSHHACGQISKNLGAEPLLSLNGTGGRGVDLFFAISGFIIFYAHSHELDDPAAVTPYLWKRLLRILPSTVAVATGWLLLTEVSAMIGLKAPEIDFETWLSSAFVLPMLKPTAPIVIWSLRNEFVFYGLFCLALVNVRLGAAALAAWFAACLVVPTAGPLFEIGTDIFYNTAFSRINVIFVFGAIAFLAMRHFPVRQAAHAFLPLLALFGFTAYHYADESSMSYVYLGIIASALVYCAAQVESSNLLARIAEMLGDASYAIYLVHLPVIAVVFRPLSAMSLPADVVWIIEIACVVFASLLFYRLFEKPVARLSAKTLRAYTARAQASG
ncbi:MAG: acyltransferase [Oricola sp.]